VIEDGVTGKIVDNEEDALAALAEVLSYERRAVRQRFEERFTTKRIAKDYVRVYRRLLKTHTAGAKLHRAVKGGNGSLPCRSKNPFGPNWRL